MPEPTDLAVQCLHCGGAVTLQFEDWTSKRISMGYVQAWVCPHCFKKNPGEFPALLKAVTKRPRPGDV